MVGKFRCKYCAAGSVLATWVLAVIFAVGMSKVWKTSGADALESTLDDLVDSVRTERLDAALRVTARLAGHTLSRVARAGANKKPRDPPGVTAPQGTFPRLS